MTRSELRSSRIRSASKNRNVFEVCYKDAVSVVCLFKKTNAVCGGSVAGVTPGWLTPGLKLFESSRCHRSVTFCNDSSY